MAGKRPRFTLIELLLFVAVVAIFISTGHLSNMQGLALIAICIGVGVVIYWLTLRWSLKPILAPLVGLAIGTTIGAAATLLTFAWSAEGDMSLVFTMFGTMAGLGCGLVVWLRQWAISAPQKHVRGGVDSTDH